MDLRKHYYKRAGFFPIVKQNLQRGSDFLADVANKIGCNFESSKVITRRSVVYQSSVEVIDDAR